MTKIAIDIDETLYSFDSAIRNVFFDMAVEREDKSILRLAYSNNLEWRNLVDHDKSIAYAAIERVHENTDEYMLFPGASDTIWALWRKGYEINYVGSRKDKHEAVTKFALFDIWDLPDGKVICADPSKSKNEYLKDCQYLIDDRPKTIIEFLHDPVWWWYNTEINEERKAFALWRPYNQNLTEVPNLYLAPTWRGIRYYMERKEVL